MIRDVQQLMDKYLDWLKSRTALRQIEDWVEITTPYLDRHNDYLQIYARREGSGFLLTDDGYVMEDLSQGGCKLESPKRQTLLRAALNGFGVQVNDGKLEVRASDQNFSLKQHNLVQAMLAVNDLFYLAAPVVENLFYEDVVAWLDINEIRYTPSIKLTGKTGYDHHFDFVIPKSRQKPERLVQTVSRPSRDSAEVLAFSWIDTKEVRSSNSQFYAILNDSEKSVPSSVVDALSSYDIRPIMWSARDQAKEDLVA